MDIKNQIINKFSDYISQVFWEKRVHNNFLCVELKTSDFKIVIKISKEISLFLDKIDYSEKKYFLDVYSQGIESNIESKNINRSLERTIKEKIK